MQLSIAIMSSSNIVSSKWRWGYLSKLEDWLEINRDDHKRECSLINRRMDSVYLFF